MNSIGNALDTLLKKFTYDDLQNVMDGNTRGNAIWNGLLQNLGAIYGFSNKELRDSSKFINTKIANRLDVFNSIDESTSTADRRDRMGTIVRGILNEMDDLTDSQALNPKDLINKKVKSKKGKVVWEVWYADQETVNLMNFSSSKNQSKRVPFEVFNKNWEVVNRIP